MSKVPDYDSGWFAIAQNAEVTKTHNIAGDKLVFMWGKYSAGYKEHHYYYGGVHINTNYVGAFWRNLTDTTVGCYRLPQDGQWINCRIMIWSVS